MAASLEPRWRPWEPLVDSPYCHESGVAQILGVTGAFMGAALIAVGLRFYVRVRMLKIVGGADDNVMLAAAVMGVGVFVCFVGETHWGMGRHNKCIPPEYGADQWKWEFAHAICIVLGVILVKISIALFLIRLASKQIWKRFLWAAIAFLVCFAISCLGTLIFACVPVQAQWTPALRAKPSTKCFSNSTYSFIGLFNAIVNICTDVLFAVLPIPIIIKLQVNSRTKVTLAVVLSLGWVACIAGIMKATLQTKFLDAPDGYFKDAFNIWNMIELCLGIIAASLPSLRPLFSHLLDQTKTALGLSTGSRKGSRTPAAYPTFGTGGSVGYRRQHDPRDFKDILAGVELRDYKNKDGNATIVECRAEMSDSSNGDHTSYADKAGHLSRSRGSMDDVRGHGRSDSQEYLDRPDRIYRTLEVTRTFEPRTQ